MFYGRGDSSPNFDLFLTGAFAEIDPRQRLTESLDEAHSFSAATWLTHRQ
jgi:hypothetical protein